MNYIHASFALSICAILISFASFIWSIHIGLRDRGRLKVTGTVYSSGPNGGNDYLQLKAVNHGRRPVILTMLWVHWSDGTMSGKYLNGNGVRLGENEEYKKNFDANDKNEVSDEGEYKEAIDLWFEDTLGRKYKIYNIDKQLKKI